MDFNRRETKAIATGYGYIDIKVTFYNKEGCHQRNFDAIGQIDSLKIPGFPLMGQNFNDNIYTFLLYKLKI